VIRSDEGTEYINKQSKEYFSSKGIIHGTSAPYVPQQNGRIERTMRTLQGLARAILSQSRLPLKFWEDALLFVCYVLNRTLNTRNTEMTAYEMVRKRKPTLQHVKLFGCIATPLKSKVGTKWDERAGEGILVGYVETGKNVIIYLPDYKNGTYVTVKHYDILEKIPQRRIATTTTSSSTNNSTMEDEILEIFKERIPAGENNDRVLDTPEPEGSVQNLSWAEDMELED